VRWAIDVTVAGRVIRTRSIQPMSAPMSRVEPTRLGDADSSPHRDTTEEIM